MSITVNIWPNDVLTTSEDEIQFPSELSDDYLTIEVPDDYPIEKLTYDTAILISLGLMELNLCDDLPGMWDKSDLIGGATDV